MRLFMFHFINHLSNCWTVLTNSDYDLIKYLCLWSTSTASSIKIDYPLNLHLTFLCLSLENILHHTVIYMEQSTLKLPVECRCCVAFEHVQNLSSIALLCPWGRRLSWRQNALIVTVWPDWNTAKPNPTKMIYVNALGQTHKIWFRQNPKAFWLCNWSELRLPLQQLATFKSTL